MAHFAIMLNVILAATSDTPSPVHKDYTNTYYFTTPKYVIMCKMFAVFVKHKTDKRREWVITSQRFKANGLSGPVRVCRKCVFSGNNNLVGANATMVKNKYSGHITLLCFCALKANETRQLVAIKRRPLCCLFVLITHL